MVAQSPRVNEEWESAGFLLTQPTLEGEGTKFKRQESEKFQAFVKKNDPCASTFLDIFPGSFSAPPLKKNGLAADDSPKSFHKSIKKRGGEASE